MIKDVTVKSAFSDYSKLGNDRSLTTKSLLRTMTIEYTLFRRQPRISSGFSAHRVHISSFVITLSHGRSSTLPSSSPSNRPTLSLTPNTAQTVTHSPADHHLQLRAVCPNTSSLRLQILEPRTLHVADRHSERR